MPFVLRCGRSPEGGEARVPSAKSYVSPEFKRSRRTSIEDAGRQRVFD